MPTLPQPTEIEDESPENEIPADYNERQQFFFFFLKNDSDLKAKRQKFCNEGQ
jgi:hypothetical protein